MERFFSEKQIEDLIKICKLGRKIKVSGINSFGQPFETIGRITHTDNNKIAVYDNVIYIEFGKDKNSPDSNQTKWFAHYRLNMDETILGEQLIVISIDDAESLNNIYTADNIEEFAEIAKKNKSNIKESEKIFEADPVTEELFKLVGKPITLDGQNFILTSIVSTWPTGGPKGYVLDGILCGSIEVGPDSKLFTIDENDELVFVAENKPLEYYDTIRRNIYKQKEAKKIEESQNKLP